MSWSVEHIDSKLLELGFYQEHHVTPQVQNGSLLLTFCAQGDLPVVLAIGERQILMEVALVERSEFAHPEKIDYYLMTTHKYLPLSTIAIQNIAGEDWYVIFGALSTHSKIEVVIEELLELVSNTFRVIDALEPLYKFNEQSKQEQSL